MTAMKNMQSMTMPEVKRMVEGSIAARAQASAGAAKREHAQYGCCAGQSGLPAGAFL